jgi:hypothetical protein
MKQQIEIASKKTAEKAGIPYEPPSPDPKGNTCPKGGGIPPLRATIPWGGAECVTAPSVGLDPTGGCLGPYGGWLDALPPWEGLMDLGVWTREQVPIPCAISCHTNAVWGAWLLGQVQDIAMEVFTLYNADERRLTPIKRRLTLFNAV